MILYLIIKKKLGWSIYVVISKYVYFIYRIKVFFKNLLSQYTFLFSYKAFYEFTCHIMHKFDICYNN